MTYCLRLKVDCCCWLTGRRVKRLWVSCKAFFFFLLLLFLLNRIIISSSLTGCVWPPGHRLLIPAVNRTKMNRKKSTPVCLSGFPPSPLALHLLPPCPTQLSTTAQPWMNQIPARSETLVLTAGSLAASAKMPFKGLFAGSSPSAKTCWDRQKGPAATNRTVNAWPVRGDKMCS